MQSKATQPKRKLEPRTSLTLAPDGAPQLTVQPRFITKANSEAVTGLEFRRWCDHFPTLVRFVGRKRVMVADELQRAVQDCRREQAPAGTNGSGEADPAEQVRKMLRRAGGQ
jgi:hypothetical protein